jgi:hypothetical protein
MPKYLLHLEGISVSGNACERSELKHFDMHEHTQHCRSCQKHHHLKQLKMTNAASMDSKAIFVCQSATTKLCLKLVDCGDSNTHF